MQPPPLYVYRRSYPKRCSSMNGRRRKSKNQLHIKIPRNSKRDGLPENNCSPKVTLIFSFLLNPESNRPPESSGPLEIYAKVFSCWTKIGSLTQIISFIRHHRIQGSLTMFKKSHYHVVKLNETEPKSVFWFFMRIPGDVPRMSE